MTDTTYKIQSVNLLTLLQGKGYRIPERLAYLFDPSGFRDNVLNVSPFFPFAPANKCLIHLNGLPPAVRDAGAIYARMAVFFGKAPSTVQGHIHCLKAVFEAAQEHYNIWDYRMLHTDQFRHIINDAGVSAGQCAKYCTAVKYMYMILESFFGQGALDLDLEYIEQMRRQYSALEGATANAHKTPDIDPEYFDTLENELPLLINNPSIPINYRMTAAQLMLEMYVGLRPIEHLTLTTDSHVVKSTIRGTQADYLYYTPVKLMHGGRVYKQAQCYMLPGAVAAFNTILELRKQVPGHGKTNRLFVLKGEGRLDEHRFHYYVERLFRLYLTELCSSEWHDVRKTENNGKTYYIPNQTQYRVHLCSYLYRQGVKLHIIELGMSHLTDAMIAYYVRVDDKTFRSQQTRVDNIIRTQINNDFDVSLHEEHGESLLKNFLLSMQQFRTYQTRLHEMQQKEYEFEVDRYQKLCSNKIYSELNPAISYLRKCIAEEGPESIIKRHPSLRGVVSDIETISNDLTTWQKQHRT